MYNTHTLSLFFWNIIILRRCWTWNDAPPPLLVCSTAQPSSPYRYTSPGRRLVGCEAM